MSLLIRLGLRLRLRAALLLRRQSGRLYHLCLLDSSEHLLLLLRRILGQLLLLLGLECRTEVTLSIGAGIRADAKIARINVVRGSKLARRTGTLLLLLLVLLIRRLHLIRWLLWHHRSWLAIVILAQLL